MKKTLLILLLAPFFCYAQPTVKQRNSTFYINAGIDYQSNGNDVINNTQTFSPLKAKNTAGYRVGIEYNKKIVTALFFSAGIDLRIVPQVLSLNYQADNMGYNNTGLSYTDEYTFTNMYISPFIRMGYAAPIQPGKSTFDFAFGGAFAFGINGAANEGALVNLPMEGNGYSTTVMYSDYRWGTSLLDQDNGRLPLNVLFNLQLGYSTKMAGRKIKTAIDLTASANKRMNRTAVNYFGPDRSNEGNSIYADLFQSVGLIIGVGL